MDRNLNRRIPGPAGKLQAAAERFAKGKDKEILREDYESTQRYMTAMLRENARRDAEFDEDFVGNQVWLSALRLLGRDSITTSLNCLKLNVGGAVHRVDQVVAMIKECQPNGLGDMTVVLKDPTGHCQGNIHRKVFLNEEWKSNIRVGSVILLKDVVVFCPSRSSCNLNITTNNILKVVATCAHPAPNRDTEATSSANKSPNPSMIDPGVSTNTPIFIPDWTEEELNGVDFSKW